jgi:hypothetical protein
MIRPRFPFSPGSRPQTHDSPSLPVAFLRSPQTPRPLAAAVLHPSVTNTPPDTRDRPQPQSSQWLAHSFRHIGGVPLPCSIFGLPISTFTHSKLPVSRALAALGRRVMHNSLVCRTYTKHRGVGYPRRTRICFSHPSFSLEIFSPIHRPVARGQWASKPSVSLPEPSVPRGAR